LFQGGTNRRGVTPAWRKHVHRGAQVRHHLGQAVLIVDLPGRQARRRAVLVAKTMDRQLRARDDAAGLDQGGDVAVRHGGDGDRRRETDRQRQ
jgi:hypothetical protein